MFYLCLSLALSVNDNKVLLERGNKKKKIRTLLDGGLLWELK